MLYLFAAALWGAELASSAGGCRHYKGVVLEKCLDQEYNTCENGLPVRLLFAESGCGGGFMKENRSAAYNEGMGWECNTSLPICNGTDVYMTQYMEDTCDTAIGGFFSTVAMEKCLTSGNSTLVDWYSCEGNTLSMRRGINFGTHSCDDLESLTLVYEGGCTNYTTWLCGELPTSTIVPTTPEPEPSTTNAQTTEAPVPSSTVVETTAAQTTEAPETTGAFQTTERDSVKATSVVFGLFITLLFHLTI